MTSAPERSSAPGPERILPDGVVYTLCGIVLIIATCILAFSGRGDASTEAVTLPVPALTVTDARPRKVTWPVTLKASGPISAWQEASIGTQVGGYQLIDVRVDVGDRVKKGQVLARFDRALLLAEQAQLQANADQADANRQRALTLRSSGGISDQDVLQLVTQAKTADALLAAKQLQLRYTDVLAPDDGVISARTATLGAVVPVGQELFRMIRQGRLEWRGDLTASQLARITPGQRITLTLPDGSSSTARVRQLAPSLDTQSRLGIVYADIEPGTRARAGMFADGHILTSDAPAVVIPAESVVIRDGRSYCLKIIDADSAAPRVKLQPVTVGRREANEVEILDGVGIDDRVVVQGAGFLNDGDVVRLSGADVGSRAPGERPAP